MMVGLKKGFILERNDAPFRSPISAKSIVFGNATRVVISGGPVTSACTALMWIEKQEARNEYKGKQEFHGSYNSTKLTKTIQHKYNRLVTIIC